MSVVTIGMGLAVPGSGIVAGIATARAVGASGWKPWVAGIAVGLLVSIAVDALLGAVFSATTTTTGAAPAPTGGDRREP